MQFLNSARFMSSSSPNFVNNVAEGIHKIKCRYGVRYGYNNKKCETCGIKYTNVKGDIMFTNVYVVMKIIKKID